MHGFEMFGRIVDGELGLFVGLNGGALVLLRRPRDTDGIRLEVRSDPNRCVAELIPPGNDELSFGQEIVSFQTAVASPPVFVRRAADSDSPWGETLVHMSKAVTALLSELAEQGVAKPDIAIDLGRHYWPIEAVWREVGVVLVEGEDTDRDAGLKDEGYRVVRVEESDANRVAAMLFGN
ncbi:hypothetical protein ACFXG4_20080 [Nocardia sp. NPDC059246]|uniref:hypothetical protein n=1 Tax=unclassified Nocardia TaxID=2637762 RepID=UPI0036CE132C